jgi:hypothetical protein
MSRNLIVLCGALLAGCDDVPLPYELDHARIMAVRVEPPAIGPGERARIDVLVTDASDGPRVATAPTFTASAPGGLRVTREEDGWFVHAPSDGELAAARSALGLDPDADVIVPLDLAVETDEGALLAQKTLALGTRGDNPAVPEILQDGVAGGSPMIAGREVQLSVSAADPSHSYRWFSSVGELTGYTRAEARLEPDREMLGTLGLVARDQAGGTAWTLLRVEVRAP